MEQKELTPELARELMLVIKEIKLGKLVTNAIEIKAFVAEMLKE